MNSTVLSFPLIHILFAGIIQSLSKLLGISGILLLSLHLTIPVYLNRYGMKHIPLKKSSSIGYMHLLKQ